MKENSIFFNKYKVLSGFQVCREIENFFKEENLPLSKEQLRILNLNWGDNTGFDGNMGLPFKAYEWKAQKKDGPWWARLSIPFLFIWALLLLVIIRPVKWLLTGSWWFDVNSWIETFSGKWWKTVFGE